MIVVSCSCWAPAWSGNARNIIAACDAYHAMTTDRPYQAAVTPQQALAELRRCAGAKFSPQVVDILSDEVMSGNAAKDAEGLDPELPTIVLPPGQIWDAK